MAVDDTFVGMAPHTVTITPTSAVDSYGEVSTAGTARTAKAYVEVDVAVSNGAQLTTEHRPVTAYIFDTTITTTDVITLPDGTTPQITSVAIYDFIDGLQHSVVRFQ